MLTDDFDHITYFENVCDTVNRNMVDFLKYIILNFLPCVPAIPKLSFSHELKGESRHPAVVVLFLGSKRWLLYFEKRSVLFLTG